MDEKVLFSIWFKGLDRWWHDYAGYLIFGRLIPIKYKTTYYWIILLIKIQIMYDKFIGHKNKPKAKKLSVGLGVRYRRQRRAWTNTAKNDPENKINTMELTKKKHYSTDRISIL